MKRNFIININNVGELKKVIKYLSDDCPIAPTEFAVLISCGGNVCVHIGDSANDPDIIKDAPADNERQAIIQQPHGGE